MNRTELLEFHKATCDECREIMSRKNHDYTGDTGDSPFANFTRVESMGICPTEQGFLVRLTDKLSRLSTFASAGQLKVRDESVGDTVNDAINYLILFKAYLTTGRHIDETIIMFQNALVNDQKEESE